MEVIVSGDGDRRGIGPLGTYGGERCPTCGSPHVRPIVCGDPGPEAIDAAERAEVVLGGCVIGPADPDVSCSDCGARWATGTTTLDSIETETHPALSGAFNKPYGYTSNADGIRHAMLEDSTVDQADAMLMLVACSAFVNCLTAKSAKEG